MEGSESNEHIIWLDSFIDLLDEENLLLLLLCPLMGDVQSVLGSRY